MKKQLDVNLNFRDIACNNPKIKKGMLYRSATLSALEGCSELLNRYTINTLIDLRADKEIIEWPYSEGIISDVNYIRAPLDPWNQPEWFKQRYNIQKNG
jgi:hypothetical protein